MQAEEFEQFWKTNFGSCPPLGYVLREAYRDRWFRIHTLPESKRYAEIEEEYQEILRRHNAIITDLLGIDTVFLLLTTRLSWDEQTVYPTEDLASLDELHAQYAFRVTASDNADDDTHYADLWLSNLIWKPHSLDPLLLLVANDETRNVGIVSVEGPSLYFPYDGGGDVILESTSKRDEMRSRYTSWLSSHPLDL